MTALALLLLAAAPQLAAPGFTGTGVPKEKLDAFTEYFAHQVAEKGVRVVTASEITALIGIERQRQLLGCDEGGSCLAELAGALGVAGLITGNVSLIGSEWVVTVKIVEAAGRSVLGLYSGRKSTESQVLDFLSESADDLAGKLVGRAAAPSRAWLVPAAAAGVLVVTGVITAVLSKLAEQQLYSGDGIRTLGDVRSVRSRGESLQIASIVCFAAGGVSAVIAAVMFGRSRVQPTATVVPGGAFGAVTVELP